MDQSTALKTLEPVLDQFVDLILYLETLDEQDVRRLMAVTAVEGKSKELETLIPESLWEPIRKIVETKTDAARRRRDLEAHQTAEIGDKARADEAAFFRKAAVPNDTLFMVDMPYQGSSYPRFLVPMALVLLISHAALLSMLAWLVVRHLS